MTKRVVVVGAGISGLSAAYHLMEETYKNPIDLVILESSQRAGGLIETVNDDGVVVEMGPESFTTLKASVVSLAGKLGITDQLIGTNAKQMKTFVGLNGKLHALPDGFMMFTPTRLGPLVSTRLLSLAGKCRVLFDLILPKRLSKTDESVADFVTRRLGKQAYERLAEPLLSGIYGGGGDKLSAQACLGKFWDLEQKHGSIIRGLWHELKRLKDVTKQNNTGRRNTFLATFAGGLGALVDRIVEALPAGSIHYGKKVVTIKCLGDHRYKIYCASGEMISADAVILAVPCPIAGSILAEMNMQLAKQLKAIRYRSTSIVNLVYKDKDMGKSLNGFGFVIPRKEQRSIRAVSFSSNKFGSKISNDKMLLRVFPCDGHLQKGNDSRFIEQDLHAYLGITAKPFTTRIATHRISLPQYAVDHKLKIERIKKLLSGLPGILLAGNGYSGVGIPDCIESGQNAAKEVLKSFEQALQSAS